MSSLLNAVHDVLEHSSLPVQATKSVHPLSTVYTTVTTQIIAVLNTTHHLNHALNQLNDLPLGESATKLVTVMKEHTSLTSSINHSADQSTSLSSLVQGNNREIYPDTTHPDPAKIAEWGRDLGMEAFLDGSTTVLAGKVLVLDIDVNDHVSVKTSFANSTNNMGNTPAAPELDAFLAQEVTRWIHAARCAAGRLTGFRNLKDDPAIEAARRSHAIQQHLRYLMMLDGLAATENEKGVRWFMEPIVLSDYIRNQFAPSSQIRILDNLLTQHALPLPFLVIPSLSFLVWLSPRAYLQIFRSTPPSKRSQSSVWNIDIPISHLTTSLPETLDDVTIATLRLVPCTELASPKITSSEISGDHHFLTAPFHTWVLDFTAKLPQNGVVMSQKRMRVIRGIVEFHAINLNPGMGMESIPSLGNMSNMNFGELGVTPSRANGGAGGAEIGWFDLLRNKKSSAEYYTATYKSPSEIHPPLKLRLLAPREPGFLLQRVPVRSINQVLRVLAVVREQCWLNESLSTLQWSPENFQQEVQAHQRQSNVEQGVQPDAASSELLASIIAGTVTPHSIPVNVYLPSSALPRLSQPTDPFTFQHIGLGVAPPVSARSSSGASLFGAGDLEMDMEIPGLSMSMGGSVDMDLGMDLTTPADPMQDPCSPDTCPPPIIVLSSPRDVSRSEPIEIRVVGSGGYGSVDGGNGIQVEASPGVETSYMPEVVRRGGVWSLPGRVWNKV